MKLSSIILLFLISLSASAYRESYRVTGVNEDGVVVHGVIYTNHEHWEVRGELNTGDGYTHDYFGRWNGVGEVTGQTDEGEFIDLKTSSITWESLDFIQNNNKNSSLLFCRKDLEHAF